MPAGCKHTIVADTELQVIEVQMGKDISVHDNGMLIFNNDSIEAGNRLREKFIFVFI